VIVWFSVDSAESEGSAFLVELPLAAELPRPGTPPIAG